MGYTAIVLDEKYQNLLKERASKSVDFPDWEIKCHHCTLHMGEPIEDEIDALNSSFILIVDAIGISDKAVALRVKKIIHVKGVDIRSKNDIPHVTLLVNSKMGGKAVDSNAITTWIPVDEEEDTDGYLRLMGTLQYLE